MKICLLNETKSFLFLFLKLFSIISFFSSRKKSEQIFLYMFSRKQGYHVTNFARQQKYQVTNLGVKKIKLSRLLLQRINEFKMNEIQRKTPQ